MCVLIYMHTHFLTLILILSLTKIDLRNFGTTSQDPFQSQTSSEQTSCTVQLTVSWSKSTWIARSSCVAYRFSLGVFSGFGWAQSLGHCSPEPKPYEALSMLLPKSKRFAVDGRLGFRV